MALPSNAERRMSAVEYDTDESGRQLLERVDLLNHGSEIRPLPGLELGMEQFAIGVNFESAPARRNQSERFDSLPEIKNLGRQTDGLGRVVSNYTVFDRNVRFHRAPFRKDGIGT
jgi:hypothetical protein